MPTLVALKVAFEAMSFFRLALVFPFYLYLFPRPTLVSVGGMENKKRKCYLFVKHALE